jgi:hypothetical protein
MVVCKYVLHHMDKISLKYFLDGDAEIYFFGEMIYLFEFNHDIYQC